MEECVESIIRAKYATRNWVLALLYMNGPIYIYIYILLGNRGLCARLVCVLWCKASKVFPVSSLIQTARQEGVSNPNAQRSGVKPYTSLRVSR